LEEFLADVRRRQGQSIPTYRNPTEFASYLASTGQENDPLRLVHAREMALNTTGLYASCTSTMAYNYYFGSRAAYEAERFAQARARHPFATTIAQAPTTAQALSRPKRAAAQKAPSAWAGLSPRKRQRRQ
jgi:Tfp pilus assembly protein PilP